MSCFRALLFALAFMQSYGFTFAGTFDRAAVEAMFPPPLVVVEPQRELPAWRVMRRAGATLELQAHVFETIDLEPVAGYGGKPTNLLVVMDRDGSLIDVRLLSHSEPIFRSEKGTATLAEFAAQYRGLGLNHEVQILGHKAVRTQTDTMATLHGVLAGTVSATAIDRSILESAAQVAQARVRAAMPADSAPAAAANGPNDRYRKSGWNALAAARLVQPLLLTNREVEAAFRGSAAQGSDAEGRLRPEANGVDLWVALASLPQAGRNLLDPAGWARVRVAREAGTPVLLVLDGGRYPLAGVGAGAAVDAARRHRATLRLEQAGRLHALSPFDYPHGMNLSGHRSGVAADAVPRLFAIQPAADGTQLDLAQPLTLRLAVMRRTGDGPQDVSNVDISRRFEIPSAADYLPVAETPAWLRPWQQRAGDLAVLAIALLLLTIALARQGWVSASTRRLNAFRTLYLVFTLGFVGWWAQAQLTIVSVTAGIEAVAGGRGLAFLLADPLAVVLWAYVGLTLLVWGRGSFCGWLCPFGALQELAGGIARALGMRQRRFGTALDRRLKWLKYGVLGATLSAATVSAQWTERLVEVEPFKTSISLYFVREWPYVLWAVVCTGVGVLVYRGYCRYVCPLGAMFALLGAARRWNWIPRRAECGTPCQTCRHRCESQAIAPSGRVDYAECFQCLDCVAIHQDDKRCLPLVRARRHRVIAIHPVLPARA